MTECVYHMELDKRVRECEESKVMTKEHEKKVETLFTYHDELKKLIIDTHDNFLELKGVVNMTKSSVDRIEILIGDHLKEFAVLKKEHEDFLWFRTQMNWLKDKLPWWILSLIAIAIASLFIGIEGIKNIIGLFKGENK